MKVESFLSAIIVLNAFYQGKCKDFAFNIRYYWNLIRNTASAQNVSNSDLQCFNCDPVNDAEGCINPTNSTTIPPLATCFVKYPPTEANSSYQCISAYLTFSGEHISPTALPSRVKFHYFRDEQDQFYRNIQGLSVTGTFSGRHLRFRETGNGK